MYAFFPFVAIFIAFLIVLCFRRVEDYFLKRTIGLFIIAILLRVVMCIIMFAIFVDVVEKKSSFELLELKIATLVFEIPYYLYLMVTVALMFSAHNFYVGIRRLLFPHLRENDDNFTPVQIVKLDKLTTKRRFYIIQGLIAGLLSVMTIVVLIYHQEGVDSHLNLLSASGIAVSICATCLYLLQILILAGSIWILMRIDNLRTARPTCPNDTCTDDVNADLCRECSQLMVPLKKRLPIVTRTILFFFFV